MEKSFYDYCQKNGMDSVISEWNTKNNGPLTPKTVSYGSHKKVWWKCAKNHEWQATVKSRSEGTHCPVCANKVIIPGENDLATTHPDLMAQWHPTKNEISPSTISSGTFRKVWWRCKKGHEWQAAVRTRALGVGCPVCNNRVVIPGENDLATHFPELAAQWVAEKNSEFTPELISPNSNRRAWWRCDHGHEWNAVIASRTFGKRGCPYCSGQKVLPGFNDLKTLYPSVAEQWHPTLNEDLTPEQVSPGSRKKIWWKCDLGHVWQTVVYSRTSSKAPTGCPVCAGKTKEKQILFRE